MLDYLKELDRDLFLLINGCHSQFFDSIMLFISGRFSWIPLYAFLLYFLVKGYVKNIFYILLSVVILITLSDQGSVILFKNTVLRLRPCHDESLKTLIHLVNNGCGGSYGFISSHASNTMALSVFVFLLLKKQYGSVTWLIFLFPLIVSYSRVYLGIHYPADVFCGMMFGGVLGYLAAILTLRIMSHKN